MTDATGRRLALRVGTRIRRLRADRGVSLSRLAADTGLGKGTLSELENGRRNPTLDTLFAITTALGTPLGSLLIDDEAGEADPRTADPATGSSVHARLLTRHTGSTGVFELYELRIAASTRLSAPHRTGVRETVTVLDGRVSVGPVDAPVTLEAGESANYAGDVPHLYRAEHDGDGDGDSDGDGAAEALAVLLMAYPG